MRAIELPLGGSMGYGPTETAALDGRPRPLSLVEADIPERAAAACWEADTNYPVQLRMSEADCAALLARVLPEAAPRPARRARVAAKAAKPANAANARKRAAKAG
jgi:hypothetical protein